MLWIRARWLPSTSTFTGAVGELEHLQDVRNAADLVQVLGGGLVLAADFCATSRMPLARFHGDFHRLDPTSAARRRADDHVREHDHVPQRQQRILVGCGCDLV